MKIQRVDYSDGFSKYSITLPKKIIESMGWTKGDNINFELKAVNSKFGLYLTKE